MRDVHRTSSSVSLGEVTSLDHKVLDHPVELAALVPLALRFLRQFHKVLDGLGNGLAKQTDLHSAFNGTSDFYVKPYLQKVQSINLNHQSADIHAEHICFQATKDAIDKTLGGRR